MSRSRVRRGVAGMTAAVILLVVVVLLRFSQGGTSADEKPARARPEAKPIAMPVNLAAFQINMGLKDTKPTVWDGDVKLSEGRIISLEIIKGHPKATVNGNRFVLKTILQKKKDVLVRPVLRVSADAPPSARVTVNTAQGQFTFTLAKLAEPGTRTFLDGQVSVERQDGAVRLTSGPTEDDYPALARGPDGTLWLAYNEYQPGKPLVNERVLAGNFDELVPRDNGDQVRLMAFDGKVWQPALDVTGPGLSIWRPAVAVDGKGVVTVAWAQQMDGDWEICYRRYTPSGSKWSDVVRLTNAAGADFHVVATADASGTVWLAWQAWREGNFQIMLAALAEGHLWAKPRAITHVKANHWSPAIAADSRGNVYVAYDIYANGNYDVQLRVAGKESRIIDIAHSARFEARPSIVCDAADRLWIAYEEGDEQWGKDYNNGMHKKGGLEDPPGFPLYLKRTVRVKCLADGRLLRPADDLQKALLSKLPRNKSLPRLAVDAAGGVWLLCRHHRPPTPQGEVWNSFALRYDGQSWSKPQQVANSSNLIDNRPALAVLGKQVVAVHSSDSRNSTLTRQTSHLFVSLLPSSGETHLPPELIADQPPGPATVPVVHKQEAADIARMRAYHVEAGDKNLRLLRGEFHRHTEYTSHNDQDGLLEDAWRYALDAADMDWIGIGDHDNGFGLEYPWWQFQKVTELFQHAPQFVATHVYERSVKYPNGHRNVIMPKRGIRPLPRGVLAGTPQKGAPDTRLLYAYLKHFGGICASHTSATDMGTDWRDNDPVYEPVVEIYQGHRHNYEHLGAPRSATKQTQIGGYEPAGFVWNAFEKGYRFGFQSSSDHVSTHMSYAVVLTDDHSRQGLIDAFKKRHCYAATDNIILDVRSGEHLMGDAFTTKKRPVLNIVVHGTAPVVKVHVIRDNKYVYTAAPKERDVKKEYTDMDIAPGKTSYYYVRIEQDDGNLAWASPMWITYRP
jgi:hypothetical protein